MKVLLLPLAITLLPLTVFIGLLVLSKGKFTLLPLFRLLTCAVFVFLGIIASFYAFTISIDGMRENGIKCMTGAIVFPLLGVCTSIVGMPLLLYISKWGQSFGKRKS